MRAVLGENKSPLIIVEISRKWHHLTWERQRNFRFQVVGAEKSLVVISTDRSEALNLWVGQVVLEGFYQHFINSTLKSSCGQLKDKLFYLKECTVSLAVNKLRVRIKWRHYGLFPISPWMLSNPIEAYFVICVGIIAVRLKNLSRDCRRAGVHKSLSNFFCTVTPNVSSSSVWNLLHVDIPMDRIF